MTLLWKLLTQIIEWVIDLKLKLDDLNWYLKKKELILC